MLPDGRHAGYRVRDANPISGCVSVAHEFDAIVDFYISINHGSLRIVIINDRCDANFSDIRAHEIRCGRLVLVRAPLMADNITHKSVNKGTK